MGMFYTNFSITTTEFLLFLQIFSLPFLLLIFLLGVPYCTIVKPSDTMVDNPVSQNILAKKRYSTPYRSTPGMVRT